MSRGFPTKKNYWISLFVLGSLLLITYTNNLIWLWSRWIDNPDYSHGPLVPLVSLFIVYRKRSSLSASNIQGSYIGLIFIFLSVVLQVVSVRAEVRFLSSYSMILGLVGIVLFIFGKDVFSKLAFPIIYLVFMVPFWGTAVEKLGYGLKSLASNLSYHVFQLLGYPVFKEGVILHFAGGSLEVADPCSGIRSLISLLALSTLIAYYSPGTMVKKIILVLSAIPLAFFGNLLRIVIFGIFLQTQGILITEGFFHDLSGFVVFILVFSILLGLEKAKRA